MNKEQIEREIRYFEGYAERTTNIIDKYRNDLQNYLIKLEILNKELQNKKAEDLDFPKDS